MGKRRRSSLPLAAILFAAGLLLVACHSGGSGNGGDGTPGGPVTVTVWHSVSGPNAGALENIAKAFNSSQTKYHVELIFQGSYTDSLNKLISSVPSGNIPALIQLDDTSTQIMVDSAAVTPVQDYIDGEHYDLSDFDPKALSYYTIGGKLYSMPFNLADPILYYDKQVFQEVGLDPEKPPTTLDEVRQDAERLVQRDASGKVTRYGIALQISPWIFEQMLAKQGALYVNNDNGRSGRATEAVFAGDAGKAIIEWYKQMVDDGLAVNVGRQGTDAVLSIATGKSAMAMESTAGLGAAVALVSISGQDPKRIGAGPIPAPPGDGGVVLGGASFWIMKKRPKDEKQGSWEFVKFAAGAEQQAQWHVSTGYFPSRLSSYDMPIAQRQLQNFPQFRAAVTQLRASPDTPATEGALLGPFKDVRDLITEAFERALSGGADPDQALESAATQANDRIKEYNRTAP
jgi:sn-glycerol 3-phosphate transport system substrate-binding protein